MSVAEEIPMAAESASINQTVIAGVMCYMLAPFGMGLLPLLTGAAATRFGLDGSQVGILGTADLGGIAVACITSVIWLRLFSWRSAGIVSALVILLGNIVSLQSSSFEFLCAARFLTELGSGGLFSLALVSIGQSSRPDRFFAIGIGCTISVSIGTFIWLPEIIETRGMAVIFWVHMAVALLVLPFLLGLPKDSQQVVGESAKGKGMSHLIPLFICFAAFACLTIVQGGVWTYMERIGAAAGLSPGFIGRSLALTQVASLVAAVAASTLSTRFGRTLPVTVGLSCYLLAFYLLQIPGSGFYVTAVSLTQFAYVFSLPYMLLICVECDPTKRFFVLTNTFKLGGMAAGPAIIALFLSGDNYVVVSWVSSVFLLICLVLLVPLTLRLDRAAVSMSKT